MSTHDHILRKATQIQFKAKDYFDQPDHPHARRVTSEIQNLVADIRGKKSGPSIEARLKSVIRYVEDLEEEIMDFGHSRLIADWCNEMRRDARSL